MIPGRNFCVKLSSSSEQEVEKMLWSVRWGGDTLMNLSTCKNTHEAREWILRNPPNSEPPILGVVSEVYPQTRSYG